MTDLQAALGVAQLNRLDHFLARRREIADKYDELLEALPIQLPARDCNCDSSWHLYVIRLDSGSSNSSHSQIFKGMRKEGVGVQLHYLPVHLHPYYRRQGFSKGDYPEAEKHADTAISLPIFPELSDADQSKVFEILNKQV